jgi:hypothetical protein
MVKTMRSAGIKIKDRVRGAFKSIVINVAIFNLPKRGVAEAENAVFGLASDDV